MGSVRANNSILKDFLFDQYFKLVTAYSCKLYGSLRTVSQILSASAERSEGFLLVSTMQQSSH